MRSAGRSASGVPGRVADLDRPDRAAFARLGDFDEPGQVRVRLGQLAQRRGQLVVGVIARVVGRGDGRVSAARAEREARRHQRRGARAQ